MNDIVTYGSLNPTQCHVDAKHVGLFIRK